MYGIGIRIYPNTGLFNIAKKEGVIQNEDELLFPKFYLSKELNLEWAKNYIDKYVKKYSRRIFGMLPVITRIMLMKYLK